MQLDAPVGSGKSPLAIALARWAGGALVTTPLNSLVDQYERDFGGLRDVAVVKGRDHYACDKTGGSAATAPCTYNSQARKACQCPFAKAKGAALERPILVTSMAMAMTAPWIPDKPLVIVDEAHNLEGGVARQVSLEFREEDFELPGEGAPLEAHWAWLVQAVEQARTKVEALEEEIDAIYGSASERDGLVWVPPDLIKARDHWRALVNRIAELLMDRKTGTEPWVVQERRGPGGARRVAYQPVTGTRFVRTKLLAKGRLAVLLTATPPTAHEVGLGDAVQRITMPMRWPRQRRPVVLDYRGNMSKDQRTAALPLVARGIIEHAQGKTIVHAHAYSLARALSDELRRMRVPHVLQDPEDREASLQRWVTGLEEVFVSVRMNEGLDLRDDMCLASGTKVLMADLSWRDIEDVSVKDRIVGIDEHPADTRAYHALRYGVVGGVTSREAKVYRIKTTHGEVLATAEHPFLSHQISRRVGWTRTEGLRPGWRLRWVARPVERDETRGAGYLAGFFDGEGSLHVSARRYRGCGTFDVVGTQVEGSVMQTVRELLAERAFGTQTSHHSSVSGKRVGHLRLTGNLSQKLRFLSMVRPERLVQKANLDGICGRDQFAARILSIAPAGTRRVHNLQTSTKTFIANGFAVHNCRTQVLAKVPWPDLGDPWVKARLELMGDAWMHRAVARSIAQAYGRAVRSETDWANFVVLDQGFETFYKRDKDLFPPWFREAVGLPKVVGPG